MKIAALPSCAVEKTPVPPAPAAVQVEVAAENSGQRNRHEQLVFSLGKSSSLRVPCLLHYRFNVFALGYWIEITGHQHGR
jgi:hypothetical protein